MSVMLHLA